MIKTITAYIFSAAASFFIGYFAWYWFVPVPVTIVPNLCGLSCSQATLEASKASLATFVIKEEVCDTYKNETIIEQIPAPGSYAQVYRTCFLTVAIGPPEEAFSCIGKTKENIRAEAKDKGISVTFKKVPTHHTFNDICLAQYPGPTEPLPDKKITCYLGKHYPTPLVIPSLKEKSLEVAEKFAKKNTLHLHVMYTDEEHKTNNESKNLRIIDQRPLGGSIIQNSKQATLQLLVTLQNN